MKIWAQEHEEKINFYLRVIAAFFEGYSLSIFLNQIFTLDYYLLRYFSSEMSQFFVNISVIECFVKLVTISFVEEALKKHKLF